MKILVSVILLFLLGLFVDVYAQPFTRQDTLRGTITPERAWWDLTYYKLDVRVNPSDSTIKGSNQIHFLALEHGKRLQIDLQEPLRISKIEYKGKTLRWKRDGYAYFIEFKKPIKKGERGFITVFYDGKPVVSKRPPWTGGFTWRYDEQGKPFVATSVQGEGASLFWPNKDHMYDEPDSMTIIVEAPKGLTAICNGRLRSRTDLADQFSRFEWHVQNPINSYGVNINIGDYVHFGEVYKGEKGALDCDYWVLSYNLEKAKSQFKDVKRTLEAFEYWFGPYPFYEDSYKLVEVPYLGMEHQSSVTYGNGYQNGYRGTDLSETGWGLSFDFIIVHETGHEWFANNITYKDMADMWIHESFTNYSESLFLEYHENKKAGFEYVRGLRSRISNDEPIIAPYNVNASGSGDMYYKGANMLHTIRQLVPSDSVWRALLRGLNSEFYHQTVTTEQVETYMANFLDLPLDFVFDQYLRDVRIPVLQYHWNEKTLRYRWNQTVSDFAMPVKVTVYDSTLWITPNTGWKPLPFAVDTLKTFQIDPNFYVIGQDLTVE